MASREQYLDLWHHIDMVVTRLESLSKNLHNAVISYYADSVRRSNSSPPDSGSVVRQCVKIILEASNLSINLRDQLSTLNMLERLAMDHVKNPSGRDGDAQSLCEVLGCLEGFLIITNRLLGDPWLSIDVLAAASIRMQVLSRYPL